MKRIFILDGSGYVFRSFYALPPMTRSDGFPVGAIFGFTRMLLTTLDSIAAASSTPPDHGVIVVFDAARRNFRHDLYPEYKANRQALPEALGRQFPIVKTLPSKLGLMTIEKEGFEADDVIATCVDLARRKDIAVTVLSSDKDLMQLVGSGVDMLDPVKNKSIGPDEVEEKFGVGADQVLDVQALAGDSSDNIPGVPGIGLKTAAELIRNYGDLDTVLAQAETIKQPKRRQALIDYADQALLSRQLCRLSRDVDIGLDDDESWVSMRWQPPDWNAFLPFLREYELTKLEAEIIARQGLSDTPTTEVVPAKVMEPDILARWNHQGRVAMMPVYDDKGQWCAIALASERERFWFEITAPPLADYRENSKEDDLFTAGPLTLVLDRAALAALKKLCEDRSILKIVYGAKDWLHWLGVQAINLDTYVDVMMMDYCAQGVHRGSDRQAVIRRYLGADTLLPDPIISKDNDYRQAVSQGVEWARAIMQMWSIVTLDLIVNRQVAIYVTMERPLIPVLAKMEKTGIKIDHQRLRVLDADFAHRLEGIEAAIFKLVGRRFTIGSPKQLAMILYDEMSLPYDRKGKSGTPSTRASVLEDLSAQGHALPARVLDWRHLAKLRNTYTQPLLNRAKRVRTSFAMTATSTGRLASSDPNLQNIPIRSDDGQAIRAAFIAEPGCRLLCADYSQIELRLLAHVADIDALKEAFRQGQDIHAVTASRILGVPLDQVEAEHRRRAKAINFGIVYGMSAFGLARQLGIEQSDAQRYIDSFFTSYPGIDKYCDKTIAFCRQHGYVETPLGRRCFMPDINSRNAQRRLFSERAAINAPLQGGAADIIKRAMIAIDRCLADQGLKSRMLLQVHDELVFEVPRTEESIMLELVDRQMADAGAPHFVPDPPLVVDCSMGDNWRDAHG